MAEHTPDFLRSSQYFYNRARSCLINVRDRWLDPAAWAYFETLNEGGFRPNAHIDVLPQHRLIYINVPKCASTTIKTILTTLNGTAITAREHAHRRRYSGLKSPALLGVSQFHRIATSPTSFRFSFVRNPYARVVSAWADKYRNKPLVPGNSFIDKYLAHRASIDPKLPHGMDETLSFPQFVEFAAATADRRVDAHWGLQDDVLTMPGIELDFVGKVEKFHEDFSHVLEHVAPDAELEKAIRQRLNATRHQPWPKYYTPALAKRVYRAYERDFDRFGYRRGLKAADTDAKPQRSIAALSLAAPILRHGQPAGNALD
jgi:hypothetical protein